METMTETSREEARIELVDSLKPIPSHMKVFYDEKLGIPKYAKFIKEIQSWRERWHEQETVMFTMARPKKLPTK